MSSFRDTIAGLAAENDGFAFDAPAEWAQGRTLFGGMTAALAYASVTRRFEDLPPLRSAQFAFVGPAAGRLRFSPALLRRGRSSAMVGVDCLNEDGPAARATFVFGAARESAVAHDHVPRPDVPPPEDCAPFHETDRALPGFLARFEFRLAAGTRLFRPANPPDFSVWVRLRDGDGDPVTTLLAIADALPGAGMAAFPKPAPISTMTWGIDLAQPFPNTGGWRLVRASSEHAADGYSSQAMRVFARDGTPLAAARQLVALFA